MIIGSPQDQKVFNDLSRDYRAGLLNKVEIPGIGTAAENCLLVKSWSTDEVEPGQIVPLKDFVYFGNDGRLSDEDYTQRMLFGVADRAGSFKNLSGYTEDDYVFTPIPFGIARDFLSGDKFGNVQVEGRAWALVENLGHDYEVLSDNRFVVVRKNSRFDGNPFLQTAPDGLAEVLAWGKTTQSGLQWALLQLNHSYGGKLHKIYQATQDLNVGRFVYAMEPHYTNQNLNPYLLESANYNYHYPLYLLNSYSVTKDNYVSVERPNQYSYVSGNGFYFHLFTDGIPTSLQLLENPLQTNPGHPTHIRLNHTLEPFPGGVFTAKYVKQNGDEYFTLFGNKIPVTNTTTILPPLALDLWNGDHVQVLLEPNAGEVFAFSNQYFALHIIDGPTDDPVGTYKMCIQGHEGDLLNRGWEIYDWRDSFSSDIAVLMGNGSLANHYHVHDFTYSTDTTPSIQSTTGQPDTNPITFDTPFRINLLKKVTAGFTV